MKVNQLIGYLKGCDPKDGFTIKIKFNKVVIGGIKEW